jgi:hypothetical protein
LRTDLKLRTLHYLETLKKKRQTKPICHHGYAIILNLKDDFFIFIYFPLQNITQNTLGIPPLPLPTFPKRKKRGKRNQPLVTPVVSFFPPSRTNDYN